MGDSIIFKESFYSTCMCVHSVQLWYSQRPEKGVRVPGIEVIGDGDLPCGFWEPSPVPLQEQQVPL